MTTVKQQRNTPPRDVDAEVGRRAHMLIWDAKLRQKDVAEMIGIGSDSLGRKLKGERGWALAEIVTLAHELGTTVSYLLGESVDPHRPTGGETWAPSGSNRRPKDYQGDGSSEDSGPHLVADLDFERERRRPNAA